MPCMYENSIYHVWKLLGFTAGFNLEKFFIIASNYYI